MHGLEVSGILSSRRFPVYAVRDPMKNRTQWESADRGRMYGNLILTLDPREGARIFAKGETWSFVTDSRCYVGTRMSLQGYACRIASSEFLPFDHHRWHYRFVPHFKKPANVIAWEMPGDDDDFMSLPRVALTVTPFRPEHTEFMRDTLTLMSDYPFQAHA